MVLSSFQGGTFHFCLARTVEDILRQTLRQSEEDWRFLRQSSEGRRIREFVTWISEFDDLSVVIG
jgi:hypothetical protein